MDLHTFIQMAKDLEETASGTGLPVNESKRLHRAASVRFGGGNCFLLRVRAGQPQWGFEIDGRGRMFFSSPGLMVDRWREAR